MELAADWVVGFVDGEGCFQINLSPDESSTVGYQVLVEFVVVQHERDLQILQALKRFFRAGVVRQLVDDRYCLRIRKLEPLQTVCEFFHSHPLKSKKHVDFCKFRRIMQLIDQQQPLQKDGLLEIVDIALSMSSSDVPALEQAKQVLSTTG